MSQANMDVVWAVFEGFADALREIARMASREAENNGRELDREIELLGSSCAFPQAVEIVDAPLQLAQSSEGVLARNRKQIIERAGL